jgi:hypothetical protein
METDDAILQQSQLLKHEDANGRDLGILQDWLTRKDGGNCFLQGREIDTWKCEKDLISLAGQQGGADPLTLWINRRVVPWFHNRWGYRFKVCSVNSGFPLDTTDSVTLLRSGATRNQDFTSTMIRRYS